MKGDRSWGLRVLGSPQASWALKLLLRRPFTRGLASFPIDKTWKPDANTRRKT